jgi:hypothetical protein
MQATGCPDRQPVRCVQAVMLFQFAQAFDAAHADSFHRIVEGNIAFLQGEDAQDCMTASRVHDKWNRSLGHFFWGVFPEQGRLIFSVAIGGVYVHPDAMYRMH